MKYFIFVMFFCKVCIMQAFAQIPVIDASWLPSPGDKYFIFTPLKIDVEDAWDKCRTDSGAGKIWDFSGLKIVGNPDDSFDFVLPATRSIPFINPQINLSSGTALNFKNFIKDSYGVHFVETKTYQDASSGYLHRFYSNPRTFIAAGISFRGEVRDTAKYIYYWDHQVGDSTQKGFHMRHIKYDGYGVLKLLNTTYDTAIRYHVSAFQRDSLYYDSSYHHSIQLYDTYEWYVPEIHSVIFSITSNRALKLIDGNYDTVAYRYWTSLVQMTSPSASIFLPQRQDTLEASFQGENLMIKSDGLDLTSPITFRILDAQGRQVQSGKINQVTQHVNTTGLRKGVYMLHLQGGKGAQKTIKLIKQ